MPKFLVIGYGNPGRLDDGLGPALAEAIENLDLPGITVDSDYQLTVEDAAVVAEHEIAIFADASVDSEEPFSFQPIKPRATLSFSSHSVEPDALMALAIELFGATTKGFALGIRGYAFNEFQEGLTPQGKENLQKAIEFIIPILKNESPKVLEPFN